MTTSQGGQRSCHSRETCPRENGERESLKTLMKEYYVYILTNKRNSTLYIGITSDLSKRVYEHKNKLVKGFTQKYNIDKLVYYEAYNDAIEAITREKRMKKWKRQWKIELIEKINLEWRDLYCEVIG